jgi:hypothetical protein
MTSCETKQVFVAAAGGYRGDRLGCAHSMNWVQIAWPMMAGACFAIALAHLYVWLKRPPQPACLAFAALSLSLTALVIAELLLMRAQTTAEFGVLMRWAHIPVFALTVSFVLFIRTYLQAGWRWLAYATCGVRLLSLVVNFLVEPNLNYLEINGLQQVDLMGGATASIAIGSTQPVVDSCEVELAAAGAVHRPGFDRVLAQRQSDRTPPCRNGRRQHWPGDRAGRHSFSAHSRRRDSIDLPLQHPVPGSRDGRQPGNE